MVTVERIHSNMVLARKKKVWHKELLGNFSLSGTVYSVKYVDLKKYFIMSDIKYKKK